MTDSNSGRCPIGAAHHAAMGVLEPLVRLAVMSQEAGSLTETGVHVFVSAYLALEQQTH
jgi:hypothetical protein